MAAPATMAVYSPRSGDTPLAIANAIASGNATIPTITPASMSLRKRSELYPAIRPRKFKFKARNGLLLDSTGHRQGKQWPVCVLEHKDVGDAGNQALVNHVYS